MSHDLRLREELRSTPTPSGSLGGRTRLRSRVCSKVVGENINASAQQRIWKLSEPLGDDRTFPTSGMNGDRSTYNNQFEQSTCCHMYLARKGTTTVKNANHTVGTSRFMLTTSPPWGHTPPRTGNGMPNAAPSSSNLREVLSEAGCLQRKGFLHPTDRMCLPMLHPIFTQSCGKETLCGESPSHTRVGLQALLDRVTVFAGLANDLEIQRATNSRNSTSANLPQSIHSPSTCALVHTACYGSPECGQVRKHLNF